MKRFALILVLVSLFILPVHAADLSAPVLDGDAGHLVPETSSFGEGLWMILRDLLPMIRPDLAEAARVCAALIAAAMLVSLVQAASEATKSTAEFVGTAAISLSMLLSLNSMIRLASDTIREMTEYGKLLLPVMTTTLAAQGAVGTSAALNGGTAVFSALLNAAISSFLVPGVYLYLALAIAVGATGEETLKQFRDLIKSIAGWCLKTLLTIFCAYMGISGAISGSTDALAAKAAKAAMSAAVPVVGGILSDASDAVLVSMAVAKNAAGLYGIFAVLIMFLDPFLRLGCHYLLLKGTSAVCGIFGCKRMNELVGDFASAMGLLLGMTASVCVLLLFSTICFLKGVS